MIHSSRNGKNFSPSEAVGTAKRYERHELVGMSYLPATDREMIAIDAMFRPP